MPNPQWFPGDSAVGSKVEAAPAIFAQGVTFQNAVSFQGSATVAGVQTFQAGQLNTAPTATTPGTVASGGTVSNSLGFDAVVYASATTGISAATVGTVTIPGSALSGQTTTYVVPGGSSITLAYTGTLSWKWLAK